jgi:hypothetical protein
MTIAVRYENVLVKMNTFFSYVRKTDVLTTKEQDKMQRNNILFTSDNIDFIMTKHSDLY